MIKIVGTLFYDQPELLHGRALQVEPMKSMLKAPVNKRLKL